MSRLPALLLLAACGTDDTPQPVVLADTPVFAEGMLRAAPILTDDSACVVTSSGQRACLSVRGRVDTLRIPVSPSVITASGIPWGPMSLMKGDRARYGSYHPFNLSMHSVKPGSIIAAIDSARAAKVKLILFPAGGSHSQYITNDRFDLEKWKDSVKTYDTPAIKAAVARCLAERVCVGMNMIDEPDHPTWGKRLSKGTVDTMALYLKAIFPVMPVGATVVHDWLPTQTYQALDFIVSQYSPKFANRPGWESFPTWLSNARTAARTNKVSLLVSLNVIDWIRAATSGTPCPVPATGGPGSSGGDIGVKGCRITPKQFRDVGLQLARVPELCGLTVWQNDSLMFKKMEYLGVAAEIRVVADQHPAVDCRRLN
jgi:hypothetical protein